MITGRSVTEALMKDIVGQLKDKSQAQVSNTIMGRVGSLVSMCYLVYRIYGYAITVSVLTTPRKLLLISFAIKVTRIMTKSAWKEVSLPYDGDSQPALQMREEYKLSVPVTCNPHDVLNAYVILWTKDAILCGKPTMASRFPNKVGCDNCQRC